MHRAVVELPGGEATASPVLHDEIEGEKLDEEIDVVFEALAIERVQDGVASTVGGGASPLNRRLAIVFGHAAKSALIDFAFLGARERDAPMLKLIDGGRRGADHVLNSVLIAQPVGPLDRVIHMP